MCMKIYSALTLQNAAVFQVGHGNDQLWLLFSQVLSQSQKGNIFTGKAGLGNFNSF